ncbi:MAG TPA: hemerythrin domain-containing protein [Steroidobacteraceae bacterium]|jgi:hemerythrin superfamily protein
MARATESRASDKPTDAITLLKQDHRSVEELFARFEQGDDDELAPIAERVCQLLTVHAQIEEEILYPAAKEAFADDEEDEDLVNEATVEHATAKDLIAQVEGMSARDEMFKSTMKVLSEYIKHHVKEEEGEMFPKLKKADLDLKDIGAQLHERKLALMEELGIEEGNKPTARKGSGATSRRTAGARHHSRARQ